MDANGANVALGANGKPMESVWDFPRPPRLELVEWAITIVHQNVRIVDAPRAYRVLETSQPPAYYIAPEFVAESLLRESDHRTICEWKGVAEYAHLISGTVEDEAIAANDDVPPAVAVFNAAWTYRRPTAGYEPIADHWAFYAQKFDDCRIDGERVEGNEGSFFGGWVTNNVSGPFKGGPGTMHW